MDLTQVEDVAWSHRRIAMGSDPQGLTPFTRSRYDPLLAKAAQQAAEHLLGVDHVVEAEAARLGDVRHHVPVAAEYVVGERPGHQRAPLEPLQAVLVGHRPP